MQIPCQKEEEEDAGQGPRDVNRAFRQERGIENKVCELEELDGNEGYSAKHETPWFDKNIVRRGHRSPWEAERRALTGKWPGSRRIVVVIDGNDRHCYELKAGVES